MKTVHRPRAHYPLSRRKFLSLSAAAGMSLVMNKPTRAAGAATEEAVVPMAAAGQLEEQTIRILYFGGPEADAHTRLAPQFTQYTKGKIKVVIEEGGRGADYNAKWMAAMQAHSDAYDVLHDNATRFLLSGPAGFFAPLDDFMRDPRLFNAKAFDLADFPKALLDLFRYQGRQYLLPQEASALMFFFRKSLLAKYGVPAPPPRGYTWSELHAHALKIQAGLNKDGKTDTYAFLFGVKPPSHAVYNVLQPAWAQDYEMFTKDFHPRLSDPRLTAIMTGLLDYLYKDKVASPGVVGYEYPEVLTAFQQGKAVMALQWNAAAPTVLDSQKSPETANDTGFSLYPYAQPPGPNPLYIYPSVHAIGVSRFSKKQQAAFAYVIWFTSKQVAREYVLHGGGSSGRASLLGEPSIVGANPQYPPLLDGLKHYHPLPQFPQWNYVLTSILGAHFNAIWTRSVSVRDGLDAAQREVEKYLKDQGVITS